MPAPPCPVLSARSGTCLKNCGTASKPCTCAKYRAREVSVDYMWILKKKTVKDGKSSKPKCVQACL